ncbi:AtzE family amidohydrolase [Xylophilus rhododendri]|uniref:AtzE family amidohydrolase n=1 Tax=Xylophilus rhododendri TaxID=2697032 RepID=A0A857J5L8_9BURK|nr:AtzE family amidohydrolase [Xylophilus rhododendri]QHI99126.1 AtzE family amidohydrolase [Xylophilus rhododendri]
MNTDLDFTSPAVASAQAIAGAVSRGEWSARAVVEASLHRIEALNPVVNAFTDVTAERALQAADAVDRRRAAGERLGALAGVPFAAKNLFDIRGIPTRAGSKINRELAPAAGDAFLIAQLERQDAILLGGLNMGEYACDFTGENAHDGPSRNPHATERMTGGSSGGSGAAVAAGMVPVALGSDTNGSIRVPSSLCGIFGLKPTYGRLSRGGSFPFVSSFDHLGPFARSVADLAAVYDAMQGQDPLDPMQSARPAAPTLAALEAGTAGLRIAVAGGYFRRKGLPEAFEAVDTVAKALGVGRVLDIPHADVARAAAVVITSAEGAAVHARRLRQRIEDFDPAVRNRLVSGLATPAAWVESAQRFRRYFREEMLKLFESVDVLIAPATPCRAPLIGQKTMVLDGETLPVRPNLGLYTQPISFIGLPVVAVPVRDGAAQPIGVQIIAPPWREDLALRVAHALERQGVAACRPAALQQ